MIAFGRKILVTMGLIAMSWAALAQQGLIDAKANGQVGERPDGLVAVVEGATPALRELVEQVNAQRMNEYEQIAEDTDAPLEAVQARAGRQIIDRLPDGQYFMDAAGRWRQK